MSSTGEEFMIMSEATNIDNYIKCSLDFLSPIKTAEAFEAANWLADLPQQTWQQAGHW